MIFVSDAFAVHIIGAPINMARCPRGMSSECIAKIGKIVSEGKVIKLLTTMFSQIQSAKYVSETIIIAVMAKGFNDADESANPGNLQIPLWERTGGRGGGVETQRNRGQKGRWKGKEQEVKVLKGKKVGELGEIMR